MPRRELFSEPRPLPPLLARILVQLREAKRWTARALSATSGVSRISALEGGDPDRPLSRQKLEVLTAAMGYSPEAIELTQVYLECVAPGPLEEEAEARVGTPLAVSVEEIAELRQGAARQGLASARVALHEGLAALRRERLDAARRLAEEQFQALQGRPFAEVRVFVENDYAYWTWAFCERLAQASRDAAGRSTSLALRCAELAVGVARKVKGVKESWRERLEGFALGHVANAKKVGSDLLGAQEGYRRAWELWKKEGEELHDEVLEVAWLLGMEATLLRDQRHLSQSLTKLNQALEIAKTEKAKVSLAIAKAHTLRHQEDYEGAIAALQRIPEPLADKQLALAQQYALARSFIELNRFGEANTLLPSIRALARDLNNHLEILRVLWLEGLTAAGLGRRGPALATLEQVRHSFAAENVAYDAALASLDLAGLYLEAGRLPAVQQLALEMRPIFLSRGVPREALAALKLFCEATERGEITVDFTRRVAKFLDRARHNPGLSFEA